MRFLLHQVSGRKYTSLSGGIIYFIGICIFTPADENLKGYVWIEAKYGSQKALNLQKHCIKT
jgi:hypothetical protein